jgi:4-diphosphocytidyl-2-C-methyl-D-erythritol kinase
MTVCVSAPAKVNLHLEVRGRRPDGYHDILSLFQMVSLSDRITIRAGGERGAVDLTGRFSFPAEDNSILRAVALFRARTGIADGLSVRIEKGIPMGGGMGGGSSDAAAVLRALSVLFDLPQETVTPLGGELGSDVPFFLRAAAAVVGGRGELVDPVPARDDFVFVAVAPPLEVSTPRAYAWVDQDRAADKEGSSRPRRYTPHALKTEYEGPMTQWRFFNDFDSAVFLRMPDLKAMRDRMRDCGVLEPRLTGSGAALIGLAYGEEQAWECVRRLQELPAFILRPLAKVPVHAIL